MNRSKKIKDRIIPNDIFITPSPIIEKMIQMTNIQPDDTVLDPCKGIEETTFYSMFPECIKEWCEIRLNKDFYDWKTPVDIVIGNPPFSQWDKWMEHTVSLHPKKICYLFGCLNLTPNRLKKLSEKGYHITKLVFIRIKNYFGHSYLTLLEKREGIIEFL